jgi:hypothetical protein
VLIIHCDKTHDYGGKADLYRSRCIAQPRLDEFGLARLDENPGITLPTSRLHMLHKEQQNAVVLTCEVALTYMLPDMIS